MRAADSEMKVHWMRFRWQVDYKKNKNLTICSNGKNTTYLCIGFVQELQDKNCFIYEVKYLKKKKDTINIIIHIQDHAAFLPPNF